MKRFAILLFLVGTAMAYHIDEKWRAKYVEAASDVVEKCSAELNVNPEIAVKYTTDDTIDKMQVGCLFFCAYKNLGVMTDDKFVKDKAFELVDKVHTDNPTEAEAVKKLVIDCADKVSTVEDACTKTLKYVECFYADN